MIAHTTSSLHSPSNALDSFGVASQPNQMVSLNEYTYKKGSEIYGEKAPAEYVYRVKTGAVRTYKLLSDGRRQIGAFHLEGDIFGLENGNEHRSSAEAIVETTVRLIRRQSLDTVAESDAKVLTHLLNMTTTNLQHAEDHMLLLGRKSSLERVAAFLLEMDRRLTTVGVMSLPMPRRDIADYLGLTLETVSRVVSELRRVSVIDLMSDKDRLGRQIVILDRRRLASYDLPS